MLTQALTHITADSNVEKNYEQIEFLGDRVLALVIADILVKKFNKSSEGELARYLSSLTSKDSLLKVAKVLQIGESINASDSIKLSIANEEMKNILADCVESIIAAIYLDSGLQAAYDFIAEYWDDMIDNASKMPLNEKIILQEWTQKKKLPLPVYELKMINNIHHAPLFSSEVKVAEKLASGEGENRKEAEQKAAHNFIKKYKVPVA